MSDNAQMRESAQEEQTPAVIADVIMQATAEEEKANQLSVVAVVKFNAGEALVLNRPIRFVYEKVGNDFVGKDGPFSHFLYYSRGGGSFVAFAGRTLSLQMADGTVCNVKDHWWHGTPKGCVDAIIGDVESLQRCYVFGSGSIQKEAYQALRDTYTGVVYPYWDYEKIITNQVKTRMWLHEIGRRSVLVKKVKETHREAERLRARVAALESLCAELYQVAGALDAPVVVLDALHAAAGGDPLPDVSLIGLDIANDIERDRAALRARVVGLECRLSDANGEVFRLEMATKHMLKLQQERDAAVIKVTELEAERDERAKQEPVAWLDRSTEERPGDTVWLPDDLQGMSTRGLVPLYAAPPVAAPVRLTDEQAEKVDEAIREALGDAYDCLRTWSAWSYGTMGPGDFSQVAEDSDRVADILNAAAAALGFKVGS